MKRYLFALLLCPAIALSQIGGVRITKEAHQDTVNVRVGTSWVKTSIGTPVNGGYFGVQILNDTTLASGVFIYWAIDTTSTAKAHKLYGQESEFIPYFGATAIYTKSSAAACPRRILW